MQKIKLKNPKPISNKKLEGFFKQIGLRELVSLSKKKAKMLIKWL